MPCILRMCRNNVVPKGDMIPNEGIRGGSVSYALFFYPPLLGDILCMMLTEWQKMRCEIRESVHREIPRNF